MPLIVDIRGERGSYNLDHAGRHPTAVASRGDYRMLRTLAGLISGRPHAVKMHELITDGAKAVDKDDGTDAGRSALTVTDWQPVASALTGLAKGI